MNINYIILAHKNPHQLKRLIERLMEPWTNFYIHIDKEINIAAFSRVIKNDQNIFFLPNNKREAGTWGDIGIVKATLNALREIKKDARTGYCLLLSGQDYPLKENRSIRDHFQLNNETNFIELFKMPGVWKNAGMNRINKYKINKSNKRGHFTLLPSIFDKEFYKWETAGKLNYLRKSGKFEEIWKILRKRKYPSYLEPYGGGQWWALTMDTVNKILHFIKSNPDYLKYHHYTLLPDEIFFHSIITYLKSQEKLITAPSLTYINWDRKTGPLPVTFERTDFEELRQASEKGYLFARKFDLELDQEILDIIDIRLLKE